LIGTGPFTSSIVGQLGRLGLESSGIFERLASGQRIVRASDDSAALSISSSLNSDIRVLNQGRRNLQDGISLAAIASTAVDQIGIAFERMSELANQAANGALSYNQRFLLQQEYRELDREIRRIASSTKFNQIDLLRGEMGPLRDNQLQAPSLDEISLASNLSADGRFVYYRTGPFQLDQVRLFDRETNQDRLVFEFNAIEPAIVNLNVSATGDAVFFAYDVQDTSVQQVYYYNQKADEVRLMMDLGPLASVGEVTISADGRVAAFYGDLTLEVGDDPSLGVGPTFPTERKLFLLDLETNKVTFASEPLMSGPSDIAGISPDGAGVIMRGGNFSAREYYRYDFDSGNLTSLFAEESVADEDTRLLGLDDQGNAIFLSKRALATDPAVINDRVSVFSVDLNGNVTEKLSFKGGLDSLEGVDAVLALDGSFFSIVADQELVNPGAGAGLQPFRVDLISGDIQQLADLSQSDASSINSQVSFSLDGRSLAYSNVSFLTTLGEVDLRPESAKLTLEIGYSYSGRIDIELDALLSEVSGLGAYTLTSAPLAELALNNAKRSLDGLSKIGGNLGSLLSRLESAERSNLSRESELQAAFGRITDVDVATESAALLRNQILSNLNGALLAQANQSPATVIELLALGRS